MDLSSSAPDIRFRRENSICRIPQKYNRKKKFYCGFSIAIVKILFFSGKLLQIARTSYIIYTVRNWFSVFC